MKPGTMVISGGQLFWISSMFDLGMAAFLTISPTIERVRNDAWLSLLVSGILSVFATWIGIRLSRYYPDKVFIEYICDLTGTIIGKAIGTVYVINWVVVTAMAMRQITDIFITAQFHRTPSWVFIVSMALVSVYLLYKNGLQSLGRFTEVIGPAVIFVALGVFLLDLPNVTWSRLLPVYVNSGPYGLLYGAIPSVSFLAQTSFLTMVFRFVKNQRQNVRQAVFGTAFASLFVVISGMFSIATFGADLGAKMWNPVFDMVQYISVSEIIQNIDAFVMVIWFLTAFVRVALFMFLAVSGTAALLNLKRWHSPLLWIGGITVIIAMIPKDITESTIEYPKKFVESFVLPVLIFGIPLVLWMIAFLRRQFSHSAKR
ncbi:GerAB/ArcD/ProY family transporter [Alicyclobacillus sp. ALC3]|uniref:GerAB/ArcD/ProY family transporter n=1 Tax=Alicyclobacillus sp. ALC3 TaxID=2796143 RepID=UPI002378DFFE|nr:endospore germination permease [Alicyclobacillus sp. ALC3]WDL98105.1 endospore germination permease [Alicyclobacillus sp. ALC3]